MPGRPSKYDPKFCQELWGHCQDIENTFEGFALKIGVNRQTLYEWAGKHEEFGRIKDQCKIFQEQEMWKRFVRNMERGPQSFITGGWIFTMKARFGWSEAGPIDKEQDDIEFEFEE